MFDPNTALFIATMCGVISTVGLLLFGIVDFKQWRGISKIEKRVDAFEMQDPGEAFGNWLLKKEERQDGSETTNLEVICDVGASKLYNSLTMGLRGMKSGYERNVQKVERTIAENLQDPTVKEAVEWLDSIGIDKEWTSAGLEILKRSGYLDKITKNNGGSGSQTLNWK